MEELQDAAREELETAARDDLATVLGRLSPEEREAAMGRWLRAAVRRQRGVPVLSLFHELAGE